MPCAAKHRSYPLGTISTCLVVDGDIASCWVTSRGNQHFWVTRCKVSWKADITTIIVTWYAGVPLGHAARDYPREWTSFHIRHSCKHVSSYGRDHDKRYASPLCACTISFLLLVESDRWGNRSVRFRNFRIRFSKKRKTKEMHESQESRNLRGSRVFYVSLQDDDKLQPAWYCWFRLVLFFMSCALIVSR